MHKNKSAFLGTFNSDVVVADALENLFCSEPALNIIEGIVMQAHDFKQALFVSVGILVADGVTHAVFFARIAHLIGNDVLTESKGRDFKRDIRLGKEFDEFQKFIHFCVLFFFVFCDYIIAHLLEFVKRFWQIFLFFWEGALVD